MTTLVSGGNLYLSGKRIFTFWEPKEKLPAYIELCIETWKKFLSDYEIILLDYDTLRGWIDEKEYGLLIQHKGYYSLAQISDFVKSMVLRKWGGYG